MYDEITKMPNEMTKMVESHYSVCTRMPDEITKMTESL
jgi:hypothetical protein